MFAKASRVPSACYGGSLRWLLPGRKAWRAPVVLTQLPTQPRQASAGSVASFHAAALPRKGLMPDTSEPAPPDNEAPSDADTQLEPAPLGKMQFDVKAMTYLEVVANRVMQMQGGGHDLSGEFLHDAVVIERPGFSNWVLSKYQADQPKTQQLRLRSPMSGERYFDWVVGGGGMNQKQDTDHHVNLDGRGEGRGDWTDVKDGTNLSALLDEELQLGMVENFK